VTSDFAALSGWSILVVIFLSTMLDAPFRGTGICRASR
jgi:hypothetical protein